MSLSERERQALESIEYKLAGDDPGLASMLATFTRLTADEVLPARENIGTATGSRPHRGVPARRVRARALPAAGLFIVMSGSGLEPDGRPAVGCRTKAGGPVEAEREQRAGSPPDTWQEHWFDHRQLLRLYHSDGHCAIYLDPDVRRAEAGWLPRYISQVWQYSKAAYGEGFGPDPRIYSIHHAGRHGGGHAGYYVSPVHDYRNVSDCGLDTWRESNTLARELPAHEIGHTVESAGNGVHGSPAYEIWGDSKWAEFYIYDLYTALGMRREARQVYRRFTGNADDFPRPGTRWFRDWFFPLWRDCGQAAVMDRFFRLLARDFPCDSGGTYIRRMNWGEYIHFTSGAAAADLSAQAARAFGWPRMWADQLERARGQFPGVTY